MRAMKSSKSVPMEEKVDFDETYVGGQDVQAIGRNAGKKKLVVLAGEKKERGVSRFYGRVIETANKKNLSDFMKDYIASDANIKTDKCGGYKGLEVAFTNLIREKSEKKGKNFKELHRTTMMFKVWLRGVHLSVRHL